MQAAQGRQPLSDKAGRNAARLAAYEAALRAAVDVVGPTPKSQITIREMARVAATDAVGRAVGFLADNAEPEWPAHSPAALDDAPSRAASTPPAAGEAGGAGGAGEAGGAGDAGDAGGAADAVERVAEGAAELRLEESDEGELALESNDDGGDGGGMTLEGNEGGGLLV